MSSSGHVAIAAFAAASYAIFAALFATLQPFFSSPMNAVATAGLSGVAWTNFCAMIVALTSANADGTVAYVALLPVAVLLGYIAAKIRRQVAINKALAALKVPSEADLYPDGDARRTSMRHVGLLRRMSMRAIAAVARMRGPKAASRVCHQKTLTLTE